MSDESSGQLLKSLQGELLLDIYLSRDRFVTARSANRMGGKPHAGASMLSLVDSDKRVQSFEGASVSDLLMRLKNEAMRKDREWAGEDFEPTISALLAGLAELPNWMQCFSDLFGLKIYFERDEPRVDIGSLRGWYRLSSRLDADALLCFQIAKRGWAEEIGSLRAWGLTACVSDRDLDMLMRRGVSDLHLHLGGARSARLSWLALLEGELDLRRLDTYSAFAEVKQSGNEAGTAEEHWRIEYEACQEISDNFCKMSAPILTHGRFRRLVNIRRTCLEQIVGVPYDSLGPRRARLGIEGLEQQLLAERVMLATAFEELCKSYSRKENTQQEKKYELQHALDAYIVAKSWFLSRHTQGVVTNPGLNNFRKYFSATNLQPRRGSRFSPRVEASRSFAPNLFAIEPGRHLRRIELRMGPLPTAAHYVRFLQAWTVTEKRLGLDKLDVDMRFAVHFKRTLPRAKSAMRKGSRTDFADSNNTSARGNNDEFIFTPFANFLCSLDRESAALHVFRTQVPQRLQPLAARIVRVDFAGQERDLRADWAAFNINLLRGDPDALGALEPICGTLDHEFHRCWSALASQKKARPSLSSLKLGLTCHAGEDFAHPLEGLFSIYAAAKLLALEAGDTIGHGLAIGVDLSAYRSSRQSRLLTMRGILFDAMIWLHGRIMREGQQHFGAASNRLEVLLWQWASELYPDERLPISFFEFEELLMRRAGPIPPANRSLINSDHLSVLHWREYWDPKTRASRRTRVTPPPLLDELEPAVGWLQKRVLEDLADKGVILEFNPSSNWRVSRAESPEEIPFVPILAQLKDHVLATINTDNPGVFGTRIENEYAIVFDGLINSRHAGSHMSRAEVLAILERMRVVGREQAYWPPKYLESPLDPISGRKIATEGYRWPGRRKGPLPHQD